MLFLFLDQGKKSLSENRCTACISEWLFTGQSFCWSSVRLFSKPQTNDDFDPEKHLPNPSTNTSNYYTSQAWETTITNASNAHHPVKQPTQTLLQPARQPSQTSQDQSSDQTPEGRPSISYFYFCTTNPQHIHSSRNAPSLFKLALSSKSVTIFNSGTE